MEIRLLFGVALAIVIIAGALILFPVPASDAELRACAKEQDCIWVAYDDLNYASGTAINSRFLAYWDATHNCKDTCAREERYSFSTFRKSGTWSQCVEGVCELVGGKYAIPVENGVYWEN